MRVQGTLRHVALAIAAASAFTLGACSSSSSTPSAPPAQTASVRAIHGSPDAGPVDIYVYAKGTSRPTSPTIKDASYPQITGYLNVPVGSYTIDVIAPSGAASTTAPVATESVTVNANTQYSIAVGGKVGNGTLQFVNFVEPVEVTGQTALIVHHASPFVQNALNGPVGVGVYNSAAAAPPSIPQLFSFSLTTGISGPAAGGATSGGEFFLSPLPAGLPAAIGFAAGAPAAGGNFTTLVTATPSQLASGLQNPTSAQQTLAADTSAAIPAGAHVSIFAVDTSSAAQLIGTLDP
jgi:hypothetical protein